MGRGKAPKKHLVEGRWMTAKEAAALAGVSENALRCLAYKRRVGIAEAVALYRTGQVAPGGRGQQRHLVHGRWLSVKEAAAACGITPDWLTMYRLRSGVTVEEAFDHFQAVRAGAIRVRMGRRPREYWVHGHRMTIAAAAERYGLNAERVRHYSYRHGCSIHTAVDALIRKREDAAVKTIVEIIREKRTGK